MYLRLSFSTKNQGCQIYSVKLDIIGFGQKSTFLELGDIIHQSSVRYFPRT